MQNPHGGVHPDAPPQLAPGVDRGRHSGGAEHTARRPEPAGAEEAGEPPGGRRRREEGGGGGGEAIVREGGQGEVRADRSTEGVGGDTGSRGLWFFVQGGADFRAGDGGEEVQADE
ncbi:unnamed protein product [Linum trigynum]|uniref:Uncharacterized protein n=1 Tax=Linum trigynum TaxID=586398 RepID=A0AAV2FDG3_9ROSI